MHFICIILGNFSFSWVIYIILFFTTVAVIGNLSKLTYYSPWFSAKCLRYTVVAETLADGLNVCCPPTLREEIIWMSMLHKFAAAYSVI